MDAKTIALYAIPVAIVAIPGIAWLLARRSVRTRFAMIKQLRNDPQINHWMVVFNWSGKILYVPTVAVALAAAAIMACIQAGWLTLGDRADDVIGGVWLAVFFLNFIVEEYEMNLKILFLVLLTAGLVVLWLVLADLFVPFLQLFTHLRIEISAAGFLFIAVVFGLAIFSSWLHGLFYYVALTPNYLNIQNGPNESSEQISREHFSTRIDTGDFLERMLGFGRIIISFSDTRRPSVSLLIWRIGKRARQVESIRAHLAVETVEPGGDGG